jgi:hypothetical protein
MIKRIIFLVSVILPVAALISGARALNILSRNDAGFSDNNAWQQENLALPDSIYIVPLINDLPEEVSTSDWLKGIYYYQAKRLNQGDILCHYTVSKEGAVTEGMKAGIEQRVPLSSESNKPVIIYYLASADKLDFSSEGKASLEELLLRIMNENSIKPERIYVKSALFTIRENKFLEIKMTDLNGLWPISLKDIIAKLKPLYKPQTFNYSLAVQKVALPAQAVNYQDEVVINITVKNTSARTIFQGTTSEIVASTASGAASKFFFNKVWLSTGSSALMPESSFIRPQESKTYSMKLKIPLYFGQIKEAFRLTNLKGQAYAGTDLNIEVTVNRLDRTVLEILMTETGQLNVRQDPWPSSPVTGRVSPGQRFIQLGNSTNGWVQLDLGNGKSGWVVAKYTKAV